ncbi:LLM class flavin-dependent oxidoreductase [Dactylosporangium siamense]|uniref:Luciferase n=1 Tax=Dactylosporangium siamense TaxID=685454 RepID=A0A919PG19_9ACTN|nr:LLM class flavin-dependent oxidoreductase [Dactylosporangium siamense]GIG42576.1 luciferase [Dactylosporangium siamense]
MEIGVYVPSGVPGVTGRTVLDWARQADRGPFSSVAVADRLRYGNLEQLTTLAAVAAVTERVRIVAGIALAPLRPGVLWAKEVATVAAYAPGRLTLGVGIGGRAQDYECAGVPWSRRGTILDEHLETLDGLRGHTDEQQLGPALGAVEILVGGASAPALRRLTRHGDGYLGGGLTPEIFGAEAFACTLAWRAAGRPGRPRLVASCWYASSTDVEDAASDFLRSYLWQGGPPAFVNSGIARGDDGIRAAVEQYRDQGADELIFFPCGSDVAELDWLAERVPGLPDPPRGEPRPPAVPPAFDPAATVPGTNGVVVGAGAPARA